MKSSRKLKDYPPIPSTPPPAEKKEKGLVHLEEEIEQEKKYLKQQKQLKENGGKGEAKKRKWKKKCEKNQKNKSITRNQSGRKIKKNMNNKSQKKNCFLKTNHKQPTLMSALCKENKELEEILQNFDKEIAYIKSNFPDQIAGDGKVHANNELWFKYESQVEVNRKLEREKKHLLSDIRQIEEQGMINLDSLTQSELILYVKQLERTKTDLLSDLRSKEWGLDKQAKDIHHLNEMKKALQAEIRHYDKEFALFRHYKKTSCPSASPTGSRHSSVGDERRLKLLKEKGSSKSMEQAEAISDKRNSLSQENVAGDFKSDVMFSSLDESKLERMECESPASGFRRRSLKVGLLDKKKDGKKGPSKSKTVAIAPLPDPARTKSKTPSPRTSKAKRTKTENKVGSDSPKSKTGNQSTNKPIKIIVTYETQTTRVTEKKIPPKGPNSEEAEKDKMAEEKRRLESSQSIEEVYEDDFEDSDVEKYQDTNIGFLTTRV